MDELHFDDVIVGGGGVCAREPAFCRREPPRARAAIYERMIASVRLLASLVVLSALNPEAGDFFPASYSPRIKRLTRYGTANRIVASILLRPMLDVPVGLRQFLIRLALLNGTTFQATLADHRALEAFVRQSVFGVWHPVGTCRMGDPTDPMAVVDLEGLVIGSENIFVGDASRRTKSI